jgi:predicted secreted Zn-dependent protease
LSYTPPLPLPQNWTGEPYWDRFGGGGVDHSHHAAMGADMMTATAANATGITKMDDPEFFAYWSRLRQRLALHGPGTPSHLSLKAEYDSAKAEYERRLGEVQ